MEAAGRSGSRPLCDWIIAAGCRGGAAAALVGAASAGHVGLVDQLLALYGPPEYPAEVLIAAAGGCDLPALRRLLAALVHDEDEHHQLSEYKGTSLTEAAAGSHTPDWREKLQWLEAQGCPRTARASVGAARCPDALDRLTWLAARGWPMDPGLLARQAAERGDVEVLQFALEALGRVVPPGAQASTLTNVASSAARAGQLAALQHLHTVGCRMEPAGMFVAARGHLHVVAWLAETMGAHAVITAHVFKAAARSGSLPLLTWLRGRGCVCRDPSVLAEAMEGGASEDVLEWLLAQGCEVQLNSSRWRAPACLGDLATLAWLRRRGCPWAAGCSTFTEAVEMFSPLPALRWLAEAGCPVDWDAALRAARVRWSDPDEIAGLEALRGRHAGQAGGVARR